MGSLFAQEYPGDDVEAFLVSGSRYFTEWSEETHVVFISDVSIERHWTFFGGFDWGFGKPMCFLLFCVDERGRVIAIDEEYHARMNDPDQAQAVVDCLKRNGLDPSQVDIWADPNMWGLKSDHLGRRVANVKAFHDLGLRFKKATNHRVHGWMNFRRYLHDMDPPADPGGKSVPFFRVLRGKCPNLIRTMPLQIHAKDDPEDMESDANLVEDHSPDAARYALNSRPRPSGKDPATATRESEHLPAWMKNASKQQSRKMQT